jgi:uncharacterized membrane protein YraQ (UPF0718 family)/copper chaperone CopZ
MDLLTQIAVEVWSALAEMAPYLLLGFLVAGVLSVFIPQELVERHLGGRGPWPVAKASLFGVPLPLCSCGVIPVAASLRRHGASRGSTTSFLISTPQTGVDSVLVTYSLLGPVFAVFRPVAALVSGLIGGVIVSATTRDLERENGVAIEVGGNSCTEQCCADGAGHSRLLRALRYGFLTLPQDLARALLAGLAIAGLLAALVPDDFFAAYLGSGFVAMIAMMAVGIPIYVCATGTVPVGAVLLMKGVSPGAVLVFLMTGPATNAAAITTIWKVLGRRTAFVYLGVVAATALFCGWLLDITFGELVVATAQHAHEMRPGLFANISAVGLLAVLGFALLRPRIVGSSVADGTPEERQVLLSIRGMTCNNCARSIHGALATLSGVASVRVDLDAGTALVRGTGLDSSTLCETVSKLGFDVEATG